jgi:uncharacterized phage protein gp47/JayE
MTTLNTKTFKELVTMQAVAVQGTASGLVDFTVGSILRAAAEAFALVVLWLQGLLLKLAASTRASTCSTTDDLDTWMADFNQTRLSAVSASGNIALSRFTSTSQGVAPVGALVSKGDGSAQYAIVADGSNSNFSASYDTTKYPNGVYLAPTGTASITVPAEATDAGSDGNADAATITLIVSSTITGFDTVTNTGAFTGGRSAETNAEFRTRFIAYMGSLRTSNIAAIEYAVRRVQAGIRYNLVSGKAYSSLAAKPGYFFVTVADSSGTTSDSMISAVKTAINAEVALGVQFGVYAPTAYTIDWSMTLSVYPTSQAAAAKAAAISAVSAYINGLPLGAQSIAMTRLAKVAYEASDYIEEVTAITINGAAQDAVLTDLHMPIAGTGTVTSE